MTPRSLDVSWRAIGKILIAAALVWAWLQLWQFVMVIVVAVIMAVALDPAVRALEKRGLSRWAGAVGLVLLLTAMMAGAVAYSWVSIREQAGLIIESLRNFHQQVRTSVPAIDRALSSAQDGGGISQYAMTARTLDGPCRRHARDCARADGLLPDRMADDARVADGVRARARHRTKVERTLAEARTIVFQYVVGNVITSVITAIATFSVLAALKVPAALVLAIIAGVFDLVPVIGFFMSLAVSGLLAATVSPTALIGVVLFYVVFNAIESYFINPRVYGHELKMSKLAVLIAVAVGGQLGGVMGVLLALPLAAIYPTIERIWLRERLR